MTPSTVLDRPARPVPPAVQPSFDELEDPLRDTTFVVVDLETTGGSAATEEITEIGAVKVRGGQVLGEFATLVDPGRSIPVQITVLTGITDALVRNAPRIDAVLPAFLEFARGCVLVAHNARFDVGFLKAACARHGLPWPGFAVVDTVQVARRVLSREEAPTVRLGALAALFGAATTPDHRALHDARATVDVLHALFERLGPLGVQSLTELQQLTRRVEPGVRRKRHLAEPLPAAPGVYLFRGPGDEVLYVGTSSNLRQRVRSYFGAGETRGRIRQMVTLAQRVDHVECAHPLEAHVRELRLIDAHQPAYNRRSRSPRKLSWVVLTREAFPRLSIVATPPAGTEACLGPFRHRADAQLAIDALHEVVRVRRCTARLARASQVAPCALAELGRCGAPCAGRESVADYAAHVEEIATLVRGGSDEVLARLRAELDRLAAQGRFDQAAVVRDRLAALAAAVDRRQRLGGFAGIEQMVAARPDGTGGWELSVIRFGRLAAAGRARRGVDPMPVVELLVRSAETVTPAPGPLPGSSAEETSTLLTWVERAGTRLVSVTAPWSTPARAAGRWRPFMTAAGLARGDLAAHGWR
ncbi:DEDD exonuclease domain-containing protein [Nakamurella endophytica]|uniref:DNA polymerase III subunit epsilon n=1 Tax=Nakamurella endophytica TaxID=1748367 RepID=A0A917T7Z7_9ACTN|nr:DEDD exonuclease domain-containing protein [Nakamurella endophytica]GGM12672.1 DNA polymerase III subunit epsilon [Nakamurella endophytica]